MLLIFNYVISCNIFVVFSLNIHQAKIYYSTICRPWPCNLAELLYLLTFRSIIMGHFGLLGSRSMLLKKGCIQELQLGWTYFAYIMCMCCLQADPARAFGTSGVKVTDTQHWKSFCSIILVFIEMLCFNFVCR